MNASASDKGIVSAHNVGSPAQLYKKDFWSEENLKFSEPWYRIEKSARLITRLAGGGNAPSSTSAVGRPR